MKLALFSPVWYPVPPTRYGGIEAIVHLLGEGLVDAGVDVTLFASGDSQTSADLVAAFDTAPSEHIGHTFWELQHAIELLERQHEFDIVHDHSGLLGLSLFGAAGNTVVHTVHGPLTGEAGDMYERLCRTLENVHLVSLTLRQRNGYPHLRWAANVHNAVDIDRYPLARQPEDFLLFLGRMSPDKGAHRAIRVAQRTGRRLLIAAKCLEPGEIEYFDSFVAPHPLVVPIEWEEPFGLVMIEALATGTPVIALRRGSVPELLRHGETGFIANDLSEMVAAVDMIDSFGLDPEALRAEASRQFSVQQMVDGYLAVYERLLERTRKPRPVHHPHVAAPLRVPTPVVRQAVRPTLERPTRVPPSD
jgi:glycosyltransferase involved in cell wall biosynthesis